MCRLNPELFEFDVRLMCQGGNKYIEWLCGCVMKGIEFLLPFTNPDQLYIVFFNMRIVIMFQTNCKEYIKQVPKLELLPFREHQANINFKIDTEKPSTQSNTFYFYSSRLISKNTNIHKKNQQFLI